MEKYLNPDDYLLAQTQPVRDILNDLRELILSLSDELEEGMSYGLISYKLKKRPLVYIGAMKNHIGFYPTSTGVNHFEIELKALNLKYSKGAIQFQMKGTIPMDLVEKITQFRIEEILSK